MESIANDNFLTRVLSWNKQDYMNEGFYKNRIQKISKRFKTKEEYYESFILPFYDDVKCMIAAEWKSLGTKSQFITGEIVVLNVSVSMHGSFIKVSSDIDYTKIFVDDLVYLTISDSFYLNDSDQNYLICYVSAIVKETMENSFISSKNTSKKNYVLQTILSKNMPEYDLLNDSKVQWKIAKIASITSCLRIDYALSKKVDFEILQSIMDPKRIHVKVEKEKFNALKRKLEQITIKTGSLLNEYQKDAIINAVHNAENSLIKSPYLLRGPPGTGKTHTIVHLIILLFQNEILVHQTAPTNIALAEVAKRLVQVVQKSDLVRIKDILLVGNADKVMRDPNISAIFLEDRIGRIEESFTGYFETWKNLRDIIQDTREYFVHDPSTVGKPPDKDSLLKYLREHALEMIQDITKFITTIVTEVPDKLLDQISGICSVQGYYEALKSYIIKSVDLNEVRQGFSIVKDFLILKSPFSFKDNYRKSIKMLKLEIMENARILFTTVNVAGRPLMISCIAEKKYAVITDEATQVTEAEMTILYGTHVSSLILIGDEKQLWATVLSLDANKAGYGRSLFARLVELDYPCDELKIQYRMKADIAKFPSDRFYNGELKNGSNVDTYEKPWYSTDCINNGPLVFFDIDGKEELSEEFSYFNQVEIDVIRKLLIDFIKRFPMEPISIGVISGYSRQVHGLQEMITGLAAENQRIQDGADHLVSSQYPVTIKAKTVDGFQGQEMDIIIFSTVRSNSAGQIGFLNNQRRLNVAITRPKYSLWIVGSSNTLKNNILMNVWIDHIKNHGIFIKCKNESYFSDICASGKMSESIHSIILDKELQNCIWKIEFSDKCRKVFMKIPIDELRKVLQRIFDVFSGGYSKKYITGYSYKGIKNFIRIIRFDTKIILWTVSINVEFGCQSIKLWDLCDSSNVDRMKRLIANSLNQYSENYIKLSSRIFNEDSLKIVPESIQYIDEKSWIRKSRSSHADNEDFHETSIDLIKTYSLSSNVYEHMMDKTFADFEWDFTLSPQENNLIKEGRSLFILGRSGTGKTTIAVRKMIHLHESLLKNNFEAAFRQLYVTSSRRLADSVHAEFTKFMKGRGVEVEAYNVATLISIDKTKDISSMMFSFLDLLLLLDRCSKDSFFRHEVTSSDRYMRETDSKLKKDGFQVDLGIVDSKIFQIFYYPHLSQEIRKLADGLTLWTEFFSIIKGSDPDKLTNGRLSLESYVCLASSRTSFFSETERTTIYTGYLRYEAIKYERNEWDIMDFCHHVSDKLLQKCPIKFEKIYIDEVQDLNMFQVSLFSLLGCHKDSFIFGGDTAQTIASGVSFRFENIRALFYNSFLPSLGAPQNSLAVSPLHNLTVNYRSHNGILSLAQIVVDIIIYFFPHGIDKLDPEVGLISGSKPIFVNCALGELLSAIFMAKNDSKQFSFSANQVIIVRDPETKMEVEKLTQERALVLTISESKGLEFDFVILYDFFSASAFDSWRVLFGYTGDYDGAFTKFDYRKHRLLEAELKMLYVAITRAKSTLWFVESSDCLKSDPMVFFWGESLRSMSLLNVVQEVAENSDSFSTYSTDSDWIKKADSLFEKNLFKEARRFYINGNCMWKAILMDALYLREEALKMTGNVAKKFYIDAAKSFAKIKKWKESGDSYFEAKEYKLAAESFLKLSDNDMLLNSIIMCYLGRFSSLCLEILEKRKFAFGDHDADDANNITKRKKDDICKKFALYEYESGHMRQFEIFLWHIESVDERRRLLKRYNQYDLLLKLERSYYDSLGIVSAFLPVAYRSKRDFQNAAVFFGLLGDLNSQAECILTLLRQHIVLYWLKATTVQEYFSDSVSDSPLDESHLPIFICLDSLEKEKLPTKISLEIELWGEFFNQNSLDRYLKMYESKRFSCCLYLQMLLSVFIACRANKETIDLNQWVKTGLDVISSFQTNFLVLMSQLNDYIKPGAHMDNIKAFFVIEQSKTSEEIFCSRTEGIPIKDIWKDARKSAISSEALVELKEKSKEAFFSSLRIWFQLFRNQILLNKPAPLLETITNSESHIDYSESTKRELITYVTFTRLLKQWDDHGNKLQKVFLSIVNQLINSLRPSINFVPAIVAKTRQSLLGKEVVECCRFKAFEDLKKENIFGLIKNMILQYRFANKESFQNTSDNDLIGFFRNVAALGRNPDENSLVCSFQPFIQKITLEDMFKFSRSLAELADKNDQKLIRYILLSLNARNFPNELFSDLIYVREDILLLRESILWDLSPPIYDQVSPLLYSMQGGITFLKTRNAGLNITWNDYISLIERMTYLIIIVEFKLNNIKITDHIFFGAYVDYWRSIWVYCNGQTRYNIWNSAAELARLILLVLTQRFVYLCHESKGKVDNIVVAEITLRFLKLYLHLCNHFHSKYMVGRCPLHRMLVSERLKIYQTLMTAKQNSYILNIAQKFKSLIIENTKDGIIEFFRYFRDDLFILSLKNEGWKPWMTPYSRFIVDDDFQLVQIFEKDANSESIEDEAVEEVEIESITNNRVEEMVAAELLLSSRIIQKMRDWADMSKVELHKFSKVSSLPLWDKTRIETEARYFFKRSHFNLESSIIEKYLTESLDLLSRIYTDLNSLNILLKSLKLNKIKQEFEDVHEFIDLLHEYHDLLSDQLSNLRLEKSFLESDMNLQVKKIWKNINGFCDSHDARKRINNGLEKIEKNKAIKKKKR